MSNLRPERLVIDTSVFITYTRHQKLHRLINAIFTYDLSIYISPELLDELKRNIPATSAFQLPQSIYIGYMEVIKASCILFEPIKSYTNSPDAKDNFLFDLALQIGSEIIVTKETALLQFSSSPIPVHGIKWFKEMYPVPL